MTTPVRRFLRLLGLILIVTLGSTTLAGAQGPFTRLSLDELFGELKSADSEMEAAQISTQIWRKWLTPDDPVLFVLMNEAIAARAALDVGRAITILNEITSHYPDYAEGWNLRATLYYEMRDYGKSLDDIAETLAREPRHYGALSGRALVYLALGNEMKAKQSIEEALEIHPFIAEHPPFSDLIEPMVRI